MAFRDYCKALCVICAESSNDRGYASVRGSFRIF